MSLMHVVLLPGQGHERHNHPDSDEILYVLAGEGEQMVDDGEPVPGPAGPGDLDPQGGVPLDASTPAGSRWSCSAIYAPAGAEQVLKTLPDYREVPAGEAPPLVRS